MRWLLFLVVAALVIGCGKKSKKEKPFVEVDNPGLCSHNVIVRYSLYYKGPRASVMVEFSTDGGTVWHPCTRGAGGEPTQNISASPDGVAHTFAWNSLADIQGVCINTLLRVVPVGEAVGIPAVVGPFIVNNSQNAPPQTLLLYHLKAGGNLVIRYLAYDEDGDAVSAGVQFDCGISQWLNGTIAQTAGGDNTAFLNSSLQEENDELDQLSYWSLRNVKLNTHTDPDGYVYVKLYEEPSGTYNLELYSDRDRTNLVASAQTTSRTDWLSFTDANSGVSVEVLVNYVADDTDIRLRCGQEHYIVWDSVTDLGRVFVPNLVVRVCVSDSQSNGDCVNPTTINLDNTADVLDVGAAVGANIGTNAAVSGDIDSDGEDEILAGCASDAAVINYGAPPSYDWLSLNTEITAVAVGDLNGDAVPDLVVGGPKGEWFSTNGGLDWAELQGETETNALAICDIDGDGVADIVTARRGGLFLWLNSQATPGDFSPAQNPISTREFSHLLLADLNNDGNMDIYACSCERDVVFLNEGGGSFREVALPDAAASNCACALDADNDGDTDILLGRNNSNLLLINDGSASFTEATTVPLQEERTEALAAFTADGTTYVAVANRGQNRLWVLWNGRLFDATTLNLPAGSDTTLCVAACDLNGDGKTDLFFGNLYEDKILVGR
ncbi:MAG: hypothetical protein DRP63_02050 [Planctomycetota bacterium]|nr:MAG: hypothetical protein DRP63_02050 [Planctomycetota bacterium]